MKGLELEDLAQNCCCGTKTNFSWAYTTYMSTHTDGEHTTEKSMDTTNAQFGEVIFFIWVTYRYISNGLIKGEEMT